MESQTAIEEKKSSIVVETPPTTAESPELGKRDTIGHRYGGFSNDQSTASVSSPKRIPTKADFPPLSVLVAEPKVTWGPSMQKLEVKNGSIGLSSVEMSSELAKPMRSKTVQEAFSLDLQDQLPISKIEFSKFVLSVKQLHGVSIESTLSKNSRTFLISGSPNNVYNAKRELVKKLTRPITIVIHVPFKTISVIIGSGGRTIKAITNSTGGIKIAIAKTLDPDSYDPDLEDSTISISLHGDVASINFAKEKILSIVKEETKSITISVKIEDKMLVPFVDINDIEIPSEAHCKKNEETNSIELFGSIDKVKAAKVNVQNYLKILSSKITEKKVQIPIKFQSLIDTDEIRYKYQVYITFPTTTGDSNVRFVGARSKVDAAIDYCRQSSKSYVVEILEISKAHGKNVEHAKNLILYFRKYQILKDIEESYSNVKIVLPTDKELQTLEQVNINITSKLEFAEETKVVRKKIINVVNGLAPYQFYRMDKLDYDLFHKDIKRILDASDIHFLQLGDYYKGDNAILLISSSDDEEFKPSADEVKERLKKSSSILDELYKNQNNLFSEVIKFDSESQDATLSSKSATLALILEDIKCVNGNAQIKLHTPSSDEVFIRGDEKAVKVATDIIKGIAENPDDVKITFIVPTSTVPRLIGAKGSNLLQICEKFGVQIDIPQSSNDTNIDVTATGLNYNVEHAKDFILAEAKKWVDIIAKELIVPSRYQGQLIGAQGVYRTRLQNKYNVRIQFPKEGETVVIKGPSRGVNKAHAELKALLDFEIENGYKSIISVPVEHVSRIIGKKGDIINGIRADCGVELHFLQNAKDEKALKTGKVDLEITGSRRSIKEATKRVESIIVEASDFTTEVLNIEKKYHKNILGFGGTTLKEIILKAGGDDLKKKNVDIPNSGSEETNITIFGPTLFVQKVTKAINAIVKDIKESVTKDLNIPPNRQGALVGPGGFVKNRLETKYNVRLEVPDRGASGNVKIFGRPEAIEACEKEIFKELIKDSPDREIFVPAKYHEFVSDRGQLIHRLRTAYSVNVKYGNAFKKANELSHVAHKIPVEEVCGSANEDIKLTIAEENYPHVSKYDSIPWRLFYESFDFSDDLAEVEGVNKKQFSKEDSLDAVIKLINERIYIASNANSVGYIWIRNPKKFKKIIGAGGFNIKRIKESTNALISIPKKSDSVNDVIFIKGTKEDVEKASNMIIGELKD